MIQRLAAVFAVVGLGICLAYAEEAKPAPTKPDPTQIGRLVAQLGSDRYEEREAASAALDALGATALDSLRIALKSPSPETRKRAGDLVQRIEKRLESAELTHPKMIRLVYNDTPVTEAVQDIVRKTGFHILIEGDQTKLANRKITLDTGEIPYWQAVDQFCEKAGFVERGSVAIAETNKPAVEQRDVAIRKMVIMQDGTMASAGSETLFLLDGKLPAVPTYYGGALRVRVLPRAVPAAGAAKNDAPVKYRDGETVLTVEISPEPKVGVRNILSVRVEKVLDDKGNELKTPLPYIYGHDENGDLEMQWRGGLGNSISIDGNVAGDLSTRVPLRLDVPSGVTRLKEVRGFVAADVLTPPMPLITMENILDAAGTTAEGKHGGSLQVSEVKRDDKGQVTLKVSVDKPPPAFPQVIDRFGRGRVMRRGGIGIEERGTDASVVGRLLSLLDEKGQAFKLTAVEQKPLEAPGAFEYQLTFQPPDGAAKAAKLVYLGRRRTTIDVPFVLKDVPVP
jgi:hypothetical protein